MQLIANIVQFIKVALFIVILIWWSQFCFDLGVQENPSLCHRFILTAM